MLPHHIDDLSWISDVSVGGGRIAYISTSIDGAANAYRTDLWLTDTTGTSHEQVGLGDAKVSAPTLSSDGRLLGYARADEPGGVDAGDPHQLCVYDISAGTNRTVASGPEPFTELTFSPAGALLAYVTRTRGPHYDHDNDGDRPPRRIDHLFFSTDGEGLTIDRPKHLYVVDLAEPGATPRNLTPGPDDITGPSWFPDCGRLAVAVTDHALDMASLIEEVGLDGARRIITSRRGSYSFPSVSPDGAEIAVLGYDDTRIWPQNAAIGVVPVTGDAPVRWLSTDVDRTWEPFGMAGAPVWRDRETVWGTYEDRGRTAVAAVSTSGEVTPVVADDQVVTRWAADADALAFAATTATRPAELFAVEGEEATRLTSVTDEFTRAVSLSSPDIFTAGDDEVDVWVFFPPDLDPESSYPMLLNIHGGPFTQYGHSFFDEAQLQAGAGYVVVLSNPRGSSGRDTAWGHAIIGPTHPTKPATGWGSVDYEDLMMVVDEALARYPFIDAERLGVLGGSYGGYMTSWIVGHSDRFKAACSERAVNDLVGLETASDLAGLFCNDLGPWDYADPSEYLRMSPLTHAGNITTPLLILHSEDDLRCPVSQADALFQVLLREGKEVEYYRFPGENHEMSRSGSPTHRKQRAEIILEFFGRHLNP